MEAYLKHVEYTLDILMGNKATKGPKLPEILKECHDQADFIGKIQYLDFLISDSNKNFLKLH
jgi:hypothetical protein